jgi:hypothetical protein
MRRQFSVVEVISIQETTKSERFEYLWRDLQTHGQWRLLADAYKNSLQRRALFEQAAGEKILKIWEIA